MRIMARIYAIQSRREIYKCNVIIDLYSHSMQISYPIYKLSHKKFYKKIIGVKKREKKNFYLWLNEF